MAADFQNFKVIGDALKRNPRMDFNKTDLLKLLSYLEGELQARDIVIATLKSERVKQIIAKSTKYTNVMLTDPTAALYRDTLATAGNLVSRQSSQAVAQSDYETRLATALQIDQLDVALGNQRQTHWRIVTALRLAEDKYRRVAFELDEERRKHERDTAQGDDITYGLEIERIKLKQELDVEIGNRKKIDKDLKKLKDTYDGERLRQKQIVLLLLGERKKIIMKYIEERKRSEDLAQILSEEKQRVDTIAEGLEEESKKSLRMEAELEKQTIAYDAERKAMQALMINNQKRIKEQETELEMLRDEIDVFRKQSARLAAASLPPKTSAGALSSHLEYLGQLKNAVAVDVLVADSVGGAGAPSVCSMMSNLSKVVQPTATVSSVPVSGPTTGIARSITSGQGVVYQIPIETLPASSSSYNTPKVGQQIESRKILNPRIAPVAPVMNVPLSVSISSSATIIRSVKSNISQAVLKRPSAIPAVGRGVPPPVPPNKPIVPPKRDASVSRINSAIFPQLQSAPHAAAVAINNLIVAGATLNNGTVATNTVTTATAKSTATSSTAGTAIAILSADPHQPLALESSVAAETITAVRGAASSESFSSSEGSSQASGTIPNQASVSPSSASVAPDN